MDHNRSVLTFAGPGDAVVEAAVRAVGKAAELIDLNTHRGVHPRLGALDVLPFVPLGAVTLSECVRLARLAGKRIWTELGVPVYFYGAAAMRPDREKLEDVRRGQFEGLRTAVLTDVYCRPDVGGPALHPTAGAVIVGARKVLIAYNINLRSNDLQLAKKIAKAVRASSGGLPGVKALGLPLQSRGFVQVSMNITDYKLTPLHTAYSTVERLAAAHGVEIEESELIGLMPRQALETAAAAFLKMRDFKSQQVIENRIEEQVSLESK
jgi:glutamate formiminotransferase